MVFRSYQRGEGRVGCVIWAALLLVALLISWKAIPVKIASAELYDYMVEQAKFAANSPPEVIKQRILRRAKELDIPLKPKAVKVERIGDRIRMQATYSVDLEFPAYTYTWDFHQVVDRPIYIF